jgi:DNA-binding beta-propeller fold protein YncE
MQQRRTCAWAIALTILVLSAAALPAQTGSYHVIKQTVLGGDGSWDYVTVDPDAHRIYIPRSTHVMVLDEATHKVIADIPGLKGIHGVAVAPEFHRGFITGNNPDGVITVFDLDSNKVTGSIPTKQDDCDGILYDPATKRIYVNNGDTATVTVIDAATAKLVSTVKLPDALEAGVADGKGHMLVNLVDKAQIVQYDTKTLAVGPAWSSAPCQRGYGAAMDVAHRRLFVTCQGSKPVMVVMDADSGKVVASMPIGGGSDGVAYDPATGDVFVTCRDGGDGQGVVNVFHQDSVDKYTKVTDVKYMYGARTVALDPRTHHIFSIGAVKNEAVAPTPKNANPRPRPVLSTFALVEVGK